MFDYYGFKRVIRRYERAFERNKEDIIIKKDFHIEQLNIAIVAAEEVLEILEEQIGDYEEMAEDYKELEVHNIVDFFDDVLVSKFVRFRLECLRNEKFDIEDSKTMLTKIRNKIQILSSY